MNDCELKALGITLQLSVMFGSMTENDAPAELERQCEYAKIIDEVSK